MKTTDFAINSWFRGARFIGLVAVFVAMCANSAWAQYYYQPRPDYAMAARPYQLIDLGTVNQEFLGGLSNVWPLQAVGINASGRAFSCVIKDSATCVELTGGTESAAAAVTRDGSTAVGYGVTRDSFQHITAGAPKTWSGASMSEDSLPLPAPINMDSTCLFPSNLNQVRAVNDQLLAAGICHSPGGVLPVMWDIKGRKAVILATKLNSLKKPANGWGLGINNKGTIAGQEVNQAVQWGDWQSQPENLGLGDDSSASSVSDTGFISGNAMRVVGMMTVGGGQSMPVTQKRGFIRTPGGTVVTTMLPVDGSAFDNSDAKRVNNAGLAVGYMKKGDNWNTARAMMWNTDGTYVDLNSLLDTKFMLLPPPTLTYAADINDNGDILVTGISHKDERLHVYVLLRNGGEAKFSSGF